MRDPAKHDRQDTTSTYWEPVEPSAHPTGAGDQAGRPSPGNGGGHAPSHLLRRPNDERIPRRVTVDTPWRHTVIDGRRRTVSRHQADSTGPRAGIQHERVDRPRPRRLATPSTRIPDGPLPRAVRAGDAAGLPPVAAARSPTGDGRWNGPVSTSDRAGLRPWGWAAAARRGDAPPTARRRHCERRSAVVDHPPGPAWPGDHGPGRFERRGSASASAGHAASSTPGLGCGGGPGARARLVRPPRPGTTSSCPPHRPRAAAGGPG